MFNCNSKLKFLKRKKFNFFERCILEKKNKFFEVEKIENNI